jgi:hypothetical protein
VSRNFEAYVRALCAHIVKIYKRADGKSLKSSVALLYKDIKFKKSKNFWGRFKKFKCFGGPKF